MVAKSLQENDSWESAIGILLPWLAEVENGPVSSSVGLVAVEDSVIKYPKYHGYIVLPYWDTINWEGGIVVFANL